MGNWNMKWYLHRGKVFVHLLLLIVLLVVLQFICSYAGINTVR